MSLKNPVTTPRIDPGTVRLVAQRLNHYATPGPNTNNLLCEKTKAENTKLYALAVVFVLIGLLWMCAL